MSEWHKNSRDSCLCAKPRKWQLCLKADSRQQWPCIGRGRWLKALKVKLQWIVQNTYPWVTKPLILKHESIVVAPLLWQHTVLKVFFSETRQQSRRMILWNCHGIHTNHGEVLQTPLQINCWGVARFCSTYQCPKLTNLVVHSQLAIIHAAPGLNAKHEPTSAHRTAIITQTNNFSKPLSQPTAPLILFYMIRQITHSSYNRCGAC
jgi:hypothetical protein